MLLPALFLITTVAAVSASPTCDGSIHPSLYPQKRSSYPDPIALTGDITAVHDPSLVKTPAGHYLLYGSGGWPQEPSGDSVGFGIPTWTSPDRKAWTYAGTAFTTPPDDAEQFTGKQAASLWAPDVTYINGKYLMYYSASSGGSQDSAIFTAESPTGLPGSWAKGGEVVMSATGGDWNAIDPHFTAVGAQWYLTAGSFWTGIKVFELDSATGLLLGAGLATPISQRVPDNGAEEGSWVYFSTPYFYLFTSWDICCDGTQSTYNVRVTRSTSISGPYTDASGVQALQGGGTQILGSHDDIIAPGGQSLLVDTDGVAMAYHYVDSTSPQQAVKLGINLLDFSSGWPVVLAPVRQTVSKAAAVSSVIPSTSTLVSSRPFATGATGSRPAASATSSSGGRTHPLPSGMLGWTFAVVSVGFVLAPHFSLPRRANVQYSRVVCFASTA